jgi:hypothetical protein
MSLTAEQEALRLGKMTASRVAVLMRGDVAGISRLYLEMIGEVPPEDFEDNWAVQRGAATEAVNLRWYEKKNKILLTRRGEVVTHPNFFWAAATLDGWDSANNCPVEAKDVGGREPMEIIIDRYQPQMQWQMFCTQAQQCALSTVIAGQVPVVDYIPRAEDYIGEMIGRADYFMMCVTLHKPPLQELSPVEPPVATRTVDMVGNNQWAHHAVTFLKNQEFRDWFEDAKAALKSMLPEDAARAFGHGVRVTRDRANRIHVRKDDQ